MYNVSQQFKDLIKQPSRTIKSKVNIRGVDYFEDTIISMEVNESVNPVEEFIIGSVVSSKLEIELNKISGVMLEGATIKPYLGLDISGAIEYVPLGVFTVDSLEVKEKTAKLTCFDNMIKLEKAYFSNLAYPASINLVAQEICQKAGITLASTLSTTQIKKLEGYTLREAVGFIASFLGGFARFNRDGALEFNTYVDSGVIITGDNYFEFKKADNLFTIGKLLCKVDDKTILTSGTSGNAVQFENPLMTQAQLDSIDNVLKTISYLPYSLDWQGNPALIPGDKISITDINGNTYFSLIMEQKLSYKGGLTANTIAKGKTQTATEFNSSGSMAQKLERYSIEQANIKLALIDKANITDLNATNVKIDNLVVTTAMIQDLSVTNAKIANAEITGAKIASATIQTANIATGAITTALIDTAAIGTTQIADGSITDAKIVTLTANKITAGTLDAANINVINLNCANLTVGTINGTQIAQGAIDSSKLTNTLNNAITTAQATADGKNKIYYQVAQPSGGIYKNNDIWFDTDDGYKMYVYNGTTWTASQYGTNAIAASAITSAKIAASTIVAGNIASGAITTDKLAANAVTAAKIAANTITASQIAASTITATQIAANTITGAKLVVDAITAREIASKVITANEIAANTITGAEISANTITATQIATGTITAASGIIANIDASKITTGTLSANYISGGTLVLGGNNNISGAITMKRVDNTIFGAIDKDGINMAGTIKIAESFSWNAGEYYGTLTGTKQLQLASTLLKLTDIYNNPGGESWDKEFNYDLDRGYLYLKQIHQGGNTSDWVNHECYLGACPDIGSADRQNGVTNLRYGQGGLRLKAVNAPNYGDIAITLGQLAIGTQNNQYEGGQLWLQGCPGYQSVYIDNFMGDMRFISDTGNVAVVIKPNPTHGTALVINDGCDILLTHQASGQDTTIYNDTGSCCFNTPVGAVSFFQLSDRDKKEEIIDFSPEYALQLTKNMPVYSYKYIDQWSDTVEVSVGIMADQAPMEIVENTTKKSINLYSMLSVVLAALQEETRLREDLEQRVQVLEVV